MYYRVQPSISTSHATFSNVLSMVSPKKKKKKFKVVSNKHCAYYSTTPLHIS